MHMLRTLDLSGLPKASPLEGRVGPSSHSNVSKGIPVQEYFLFECVADE